MKVIKRAICKTWNGESGSEMRGMMGTWRIRVRTRGIKVGMWKIRVGLRGMGVRMWGIRVGMWESERFFVRIFAFIALAKIQESEGSISPSSFYGQLPDY